MELRAAKNSVLVMGLVRESLLGSSKFTRFERPICIVLVLSITFFLLFFAFVYFS